VTRSLCSSLSLSLCIFSLLPPSPSNRSLVWFLSRSLARIVLHHSLSSTVSFTFATSCSRTVSSRSPPFPSYSLLLALRPFLLLLGRFYSPIFIFLSTRSFIRARSFPSHPPSLIYPFNLSVFLRLYDRTSIPPFLSLFFSVFRLAQPTNLSAFRVALYTCQVSRNCETIL